MNEFSLKETKRIIGLIEQAMGSINSDVENIQSQIDEFNKIKDGLIEEYGEKPEETDLWGVKYIYDMIDTNITRFNEMLGQYNRQRNCEHDNIIFNQPFQDERGNTIFKTYCKDCGLTIEQKNQNGQIIQ